MNYDNYNWKPIVISVTTSAATFGVVVPSTMHMELKDLSYSNDTAAVNKVTLRQIPSGNIRPASSIIIDQETLVSQTPYSPRIPVGAVQENCVLEASANLGPATIAFSYRLVYGRP